MNEDRKQEIISRWGDHYREQHGYEPYEVNMSAVMENYDGAKVAGDADRWCGAWIGKYVCYSISGLDPDGVDWRLGFWGNDDFGMVKDSNDRQSLEDLLETIPDTVTIESLKALGFEIF